MKGSNASYRIFQSRACTMVAGLLVLSAAAAVLPWRALGSALSGRPTLLERGHQRTPFAKLGADLTEAAAAAAFEARDTRFAPGSGSATSGRRFTGAPFRGLPNGTSVDTLLKRALGCTYNNSCGSTAGLQGCNAQRPFAAVVTTIASAPTEAVTELASARPDVDVFVVADRKGPKSWPKATPANIHYLTVPHQEQHKFQAFSPPWNHFGRKNYGYLAALASGACFIWDFDDDNVLLDAKNGVLKTAHLTSWAESTLQLSRAPSGGTSSPWINHLPFMGATSFIWPRGTPLEQVQDSSTFLPTVSGAQACKQDAARPGCIRLGPTCSCLGILSSLAQGNPDLDAVQRLTGPAPVDFKRELGVMGILGPGTTVSHNAQATLLSRDVVLFAMLPMTVHGRVSDIWRALIANRIAELAGLAVAVTSGAVVHHRNPHNYLADLDAEQPLYAQAGVLGQLLQAWTPNSNSIAGATVEVYVHLYERGVLEWPDVTWAVEWVRAVVGLVGDAPVKEQAALPSPSAPIPRLAGVTAIVHINFDHTEVIAPWLAIWGRVYDGVVFYVPGREKCEVPGLPRGINVRMVCHVPSDTRPRGGAPGLRGVAGRNSQPWKELFSGYFAYESLLHALLNTPVPDKGYMFMHDDAIVNVPLMAQKLRALKPGVSLPCDKAITRLAYNAGDKTVSRMPKHSEWMWSTHDIGIRALQAAAREDPAIHSALAFCQEKIGGIPADSCDSYFWPAAGRTESVAFLQTMLKHRVFLEIAMPIAAHCGPARSGSPGVGAPIVKGDRTTPYNSWKDFDPKRHIYVHPVKLGLRHGPFVHAMVRDGKEKEDRKK